MYSQYSSLGYATATVANWVSSENRVSRQWEKNVKIKSLRNESEIVNASLGKWTKCLRQNLNLVKTWTSKKCAHQLYILTTGVSVYSNNSQCFVYSRYHCRVMKSRTIDYHCSSHSHWCINDTFRRFIAITAESLAQYWELANQGSTNDRPTIFIIIRAARALAK